MSINTNMKWDLSRSADQASKVISSLTIQLNGSSQGSYNGSAARTVNITPSSIGAAASNIHIIMRDRLVLEDPQIL